MIASLLFSFILTFNACTGVLEFPDYKDHPCKRRCNGKQQICKYDFALERMFTMEMNNCKDCLGSTPSDCLNPNCIVADGLTKFSYAINRRIPGPGIEVCLGDIISVTVSNHLIDASTSIHWHGQHQLKTPHMDGVPMVTQCPIPPGTKFRYEFEATQSGTHFFHSHSGFQRTGGLFGSLVVKVPDNVNKIRRFYDYDLSDHVITLADWSFHESMDDFFASYRLKIFGSAVSALLVNGFGSTVNNNVPVPIFTVKQNYRYRFRMIHAGTLSCPISISVQNHKLYVVSVDGNDILQQPVDVITITNGERFDFIISANKRPDFYWIKIVGASACAGLESLALLRYDARNVINIPSKNSSHVNITQKTEMNCVNVPSNTKNCYSYMNLTSVDKIEDILRQTPDFKYFIGFKLYPDVLPAYQDYSNRVVSFPAFNNIANKMPSSNLLESGNSKVKFCNQENMLGCNTTGNTLCECLHLVEIPQNSVVELILSSDSLGPVVHPIHLHGHSFRVIAHESFGENVSVEQIKQLDTNGFLHRNLKNPPLKDVIPTPNGGYSIVRFIAYNPGYWLMHCHLEFHMEIGMSMLFKVGDPERPPSNFPKCGDYLDQQHID